MCLPATHFHDRPPLTGSGLDLVDELAGKVGIAEFVQVLHDFTSECSIGLGQRGGIVEAGLFGGQLEPVGELFFQHAEVFEFGQRPHR